MATCQLLALAMVLVSEWNSGGDGAGATNLLQLNFLRALLGVEVLPRVDNLPSTCAPSKLAYDTTLNL